MKKHFSRPVIVLLFALLGSPAFGEMRTWTSAADATKTFEAEFRSVDGEVVNLVTADGRLLPVRLDILSEADREYVKTKAAAGPPAPGLGEVDPELEDAPLPKALGRKLVQMEGKSVRRYEAEPTKYYLIYHAASFSGPCFKAAPEIGKKYTDLVLTNPKVQMVYVAHDKEEDGMKEMLTEFGVPVPALKFGEWEDIELLTKQLPDRVTVPVYQVLDAKGELVISGEDVFEKLKDLE